MKAKIKLYVIACLIITMVTTKTAGEFTFYYDEQNRLIKEQGIYGTITYTYDALGIRSSLIENGVATQYMTCHGVVLAGYNSKGERTEHYTYGNKIIAWE